MKKATLLALTMALFLALTAGVAVADDLRGTRGDDVIVGTNGADEIKGLAGDDRLSGRGGGDRIQGGAGNDKLFGDKGADLLIGKDGRDLFVGGNGNDRIFAAGKGVDTIFCGNGFDVAHVSLNDLIGGESVEDILSHVTGIDGPVLSCEVLVIGGLRVPLGAIVALPADLERDVSLLLEDFLRDGELDAGEIEDLVEVFDLIEDGDLDALENLLDELLGLL